MGNIFSELQQIIYSGTIDPYEKQQQTALVSPSVIQPITIIQSTWNSFDLAIGANRDKIVQYALTHASNPLFRALLAPEIRQAATITATHLNQKLLLGEQFAENSQELANTLPSSMHTDELKVVTDYMAALNSMQSAAAAYNSILGTRLSLKQLDTYIENNLKIYEAFAACKQAKANCAAQLDSNFDKLKSAVATLNVILEKHVDKISLVNLDTFLEKEKINIEKNRQIYEDYNAYKKLRDSLDTAEIKLNEYCNNQATYEEYVKGYYGEHQCFALERCFAGETAHTSMIDIVARMLQADIVIYKNGEKIYSATITDDASVRDNVSVIFEVQYNGPNNFELRRIVTLDHSASTKVPAAVKHSDIPSEKPIVSPPPPLLFAQPSSVTQSNGSQPPASTHHGWWLGGLVSTVGTVTGAVTGATDTVKSIFGHSTR